MAKAKPSYGDMIDLPDDPGPVAQKGDHTTKQSYDSTPVATRSPRRRSRRHAPPTDPKPEPKDYVQRSLYAREETFERIRQYAFKVNRPAQELYREGLLYVLQKYQIDEGISSAEDV